LILPKICPNYNRYDRT